MESVKPDAAARRGADRRPIRRARLLDLLDRAAARVVVLTAPAGYGKTTLATQWLAGRPRVAWYSASAGSSDLAAFSVELADAASFVVQGAGERLRRRARVEEAPEQAAVALAELLGEDLAAWPDDAWLVVDEYHTLAASPAVDRF